MNEEYVTIKKSDYEQLIDKYMCYETNEKRVIYIESEIYKLETKLKDLVEMEKYVCLKKKIKLEIHNLSDEIWRTKHYYSRLLDSTCDTSLSDINLVKQKFPVAENSKECHCSNETSKPAPA